MDGVVGKPTERCERSRWGLKEDSNWIGSRGQVTDQWPTELQVVFQQWNRKRDDNEAQRAVSATGPTTSAQLAHRALCSTRIFLNLMTFWDEGSKFFGSVWNYLTNNAFSHQKTLIFICTALRTSNPICVMSVCVCISARWMVLCCQWIWSKLT
jgi:hypothetical protein